MSLLHWKGFKTSNNIAMSSWFDFWRSCTNFRFDSDATSFLKARKRQVYPDILLKDSQHSHQLRPSRRAVGWGDAALRGSQPSIPTVTSAINTTTATAMPTTFTRSYDIPMILRGNENRISSDGVSYCFLLFRFHASHICDTPILKRLRGEKNDKTSKLTFSWNWKRWVWIILCSQQTKRGDEGHYRWPIRELERECLIGESFWRINRWQH